MCVVCVWWGVGGWVGGGVGGGGGVCVGGWPHPHGMVGTCQQRGAERAHGKDSSVNGHNAQEAKAVGCCPGRPNTRVRQAGGWKQQGGEGWGIGREGWWASSGRWDCRVKEIPFCVVESSKGAP